MNIFLLGLSVVFLVCNNIGLKLIKGEKNEKIINLVVVTGVSLIVSLIIVLCTGDEITKDMFFYGLLFGLVLVFGSICNYCAYERGSLAGTTLFNQGGLVVVVLFGIIYFKEDFNLILGLGVISMLIALTLMSMPETNDKKKKSFNLVWLLFCIVVLFANSAISIVTKFRQVNVDGKNPFAFMFICYLFSFVLYTFACSPVLLDDFEKETGIKIRAEDIVDGGCYNNTFRVPTETYKKYMDFVQKRISVIAKEIVDIVHGYALPKEKRG